MNGASNPPADPHARPLDLNETFRGGGFRGTIDIDDEQVVGRRLPDLRITRRLAQGLQPLGGPDGTLQQ